MSNISSLRPIHTILDQEAQIRKEQGDAWTTDGYLKGYHHNPHIHIAGQESSYDRTFKEALKGLVSPPTLQAFLEHRKALNLPTNVLDLMGSGIFPESADYIDSIIGVRLKDNDDYLRSAATSIGNNPDDIEKTFSHPNRHIIEGNVFTKRTFNRIKHTKEAMGLPGFDLITCRPDGPFRNGWLESTGVQDDNNTALYFSVQLQRVISLLADGGVALIQVPQIKAVEDKLDAINKLLGGGDITFHVYNSEYPENSKVLLVQKADVAVTK